MPYKVEGDLLCWIWTGCTDSRGTPVIRTRGGQTTARRHFWEQENGPVPEGKVLANYWHTRLCIRARHSVPVTPRELKELTGQVVLTARDARNALRMRAAGLSRREVARRLDVS
jgi:hypothetical protein